MEPFIGTQVIKLTRYDMFRSYIFKLLVVYHEVLKCFHGVKNKRQAFSLI